MVLYGITLVLVGEELRDTYPNLQSPFYANDSSFDRPARRSMEQMLLLMDWVSDQGYLFNLAKLLFIANNLEEKEAARWEFKQAGLNLNYVDSSRYLGDYWVPKEELEEWVRPKLDACSHGVRTLAKIGTSRNMMDWGCRSRSSGSTCKEMSLGLAI